MSSMERLRLLTFVLALAVFASIGASTQAQTDQGDYTHTQPGKPVPDIVRRIPFPIDSQAPKTALAVEFRAAEQMTEKDRLLEADAESAIGEKAGFADLEFNVGKWSYQQIVCPALPNHLFLGFTCNNGVGDVSLFTASIPRNGEGRVRIIPIQRSGYSLFSPAPINALTISAFNHIRTEEHYVQPPDWAGTALCYAALAGAHPQTEIPVATPMRDNYLTGPQAIMEIPAKGGAIIRFTDASKQRRPMAWTLIFNSTGRLLKATHLPAPKIAVKVVPPAKVDGQGRVIEAGAKPIPRSQR